MNKKEVLEIRKQFSPANCAITRICGCYVNHEKEKVTEWMNAFLSLPEEEEFKYFEMFKKTLSGTIGKNLLHMEFPLEQEREEGTQTFLLKLRNSKLQDEMLLAEFYDKVIASYEYAENYYIVLMHAVYDIPSKSRDGLMMEDASDYMYEHILCSICPVNLSKPGLSYNTENNLITERTRDWIVDAPMKGFLFPAFTDRNTDIHSVMYYSKKPEELQGGFIDTVLGSKIPMTAGDQKDNFNMVLEDTLGEQCDYEIIRNVHENLNELLEENKDNPEPIELSKPDVKRLLEHSGVTQEQLETFDQQYEMIVGEKQTLMATNIAEPKKFQIQTPDVMIKVNPERTDLVETRMIDGRQCLVIPVDDHIEVNGVNVKTISQDVFAE
ncbi:MAG: DUF4317 domain-containing protein [Eubacteriales bacterium]